MSHKRRIQVLVTLAVICAAVVLPSCNSRESANETGRPEHERGAKREDRSERASDQPGSTERTLNTGWNVSSENRLSSGGSARGGEFGNAQLRAVSPKEQAAFDECLNRGKSELKSAEYRKAINSFSEALKMKDSADAHFFRAISFLSISDASPALDDLDAVETLAPGTVLALMARAYNLSIGTAEFAKAEKLIDTAIAREPANPLCYFIKAAVCSNDGRKRLLNNQKALALAPDDLRLSEQRANIFLAFKDYAKARDGFAQVLKGNPDALTSISYTGYVYFNQKKMSEAEPYGKIATARDPLYLPSRVLLNLIYRERNQKSKCYALWDKPSAALDAMPMFHLHRATCYQSWKDYKLAKREMDIFMAAARRKRFTQGELLHAYATQVDIYRGLGDKQNAFKSAQAARAIAPESVTALAVFVEASRLLGREQDVLDEVEEFLKLPLSDEEKGTALIYKAESYRNLNRLSELESTLKTASKLLPNEPTIPAIRAYHLASQKKYLEAIRMFQTAEKLGKDKFETKGSIADCALAAGQFDFALKRANELVSVYPQEARGWLLRARAYHAKQDIPRMREDLKHLMTLPYLNSNDYEVAGNVYFHGGEPKAAADCFGKVLVLEARSPDVRRKVGAFNRLLTPDVMIRATAGYVSNEPANAAAHAAFALCLTSARRNVDAMKELNKAIELEPNAANFYIERATLHLEFGEDEEASRDFNKALNELNFESVAGLRGRGTVYAEQGRLDKAIADFTRAIEREPAGFDAPYMERAACYRQLNNIPKAIADLELADRYETMQTSIVRKRLAELYMMVGATQKALSLYSAVLRINPSDVQAFEGRADAFVKLKKFSEALKDYDEVVRRNDSATGVYYRRALVYRRLGKLKEALADESHAKSIDSSMLGAEKQHAPNRH